MKSATWIAQRAALFRVADPAIARWAAGFGPIAHDDATQLRVRELADMLVAQRCAQSVAEVFELLVAADRLTLGAMWLTVHLSYAQRVHVDGREMAPEDFKVIPEGHTGGSLNMVPAYVGYLCANALTRHTRGWLMGQGHAVAGIEACNVLIGNLHDVHARRYGWTSEGLSRMAQDFYSYAIAADGSPASPLGSHVNANTAGGLSEGGYLGFAELQYVHMPLPGERLVAFLSDGAFEEQRGSDWAPRWWRGEDCGFVAPIMILNGRRIEQRSTMQQQGGVPWLCEHLQLNGFDPIEIDGRDPAAFAWAILTMEDRQAACAAAVRAGEVRYPVPLHYAIAEAPKGWGFAGAGTNLAHNLPLGANPRSDDDARRRFNDSARALWVAPDELQAAAAALCRHAEQGRPLERDNVFANRVVPAPWLPAALWRQPGETACSPMAAVDHEFAAIVQANPNLRPRIGNPDELRSNQMNATLDLLKHRVVVPEAGVAESVTGAVVTALNEEAVVSAALANKSGINLVVSYEAFAVKMLGALRQEILFARHLTEAGRPPRWLSVVTLATSHTWENGKNEQSHQDTTFCEALMGEMSDTSRVGFPVDANSAVAALHAAYATHGQFWTLVTPKRVLPNLLTPTQARQLVEVGVLAFRSPPEAQVALVAVGAYQLAESIKAADRLHESGIAAALLCIFEPGRLRQPRDAREGRHVLGDDALAALLPGHTAVRVVAGHARPEAMAGLLRRIDTGPKTTRFLGYIGRGGTLDVGGMLFANRCTWAHIVAAAADLLALDPFKFLRGDERVAVTESGDPCAVMSRY